MFLNGFRFLIKIIPFKLYGKAKPNIDMIASKVSGNFLVLLHAEKDNGWIFRKIAAFLATLLANCEPTDACSIH